MRESEILVICCHQDSRVANMLSSLWLLNIIIITLPQSQDICWCPWDLHQSVPARVDKDPKLRPAWSHSLSLSSSYRLPITTLTIHLHKAKITCFFLLSNLDLLILKVSFLDQSLIDANQIDNYILCIIDAWRSTCLLRVSLSFGLFLFEKVLEQFREGTRNTTWVGSDGSLS